MSITRKIFLFVAAPLIVIFLGVAIWVLSSDPNQSENQATTIPTTATLPTKQPRSNQAEPKAKMKHLGLMLAPYNASTGMAGDLKFSKEKFDGGMQTIFVDYGYIIKGENSADGRDKENLQPTFAAPLGTKVRAVTDGVVFDVPKLYSDDYSVQIYDGKEASWIWEMEHVINPVVKKGDKVTAGQVVAEVSNYSLNTFNGLGFFELGLLRGGQTPTHYCPFQFLDDTFKPTALTSLSTLMKDWETYRNDPTVYPDESTYPVVGCRKLDPIEG